MIEALLGPKNGMIPLRNNLAMRRETFHLCLHLMQTSLSVGTGTRFPAMTISGSLMPLDILFLCDSLRTTVNGGTLNTPE